MSNLKHVGVPFGALVGLTLTSVDHVRKGEENETISFRSDSGRMFKLFHDQDCCESVTVEDICGDLTDLIGSPVVVAQESVSNNYGEPDSDGDIMRPDDSSTWSFYILRTNKGTVTIRWCGTSNGYYSESVDFVEIVAEEAK